jgi:hypothetical protein
MSREKFTMYILLNDWKGILKSTGTVQVGREKGNEVPKNYLVRETGLFTA